MTNLLNKTMVSIAILMAGSSQASAQKESIAVVFRSKLPYYSSPQVSNGQPLGYFTPGTRSCVTDEIVLNGSDYVEYILPYSKGVAWAKIPHYNTPAEGQKVIATLFALDPANDIDCRAELAALLRKAPLQPQRPVVAIQPAPKYTLTPQDERKYTAVLENILKHDSAGWVENKYIPNTVNDLHVIYDKDSGEVLGLRASYRFIDGFCPYADNDLTCNKSGWLIARLDRKPTCLVYWDDKDTCRPVTEHDAAYKLREALKNAPPQHSQPKSESPIEHGLKCAWIGHNSPMAQGLAGCW